MSQRKLFSAVVGITALAAVAAIAVSSATAAGAKATSVKIALGTKSGEFALIASARSAPAGAITFVVRNGGKLPHEFVVVKTKVPAAKLPMSGGKASEKGAVGEIEEFNPGLTKRLTLTLKPGHYVLICNVAGHYSAGQHTDFRVT